MKIKGLLLLGLIFLTILYFKPLSGYFSQDDFYHLRQVMDKNYSDIPSFFIPLYFGDATFYRPVSRELYNFFALKTFGLNPLPYHLVNLFLIITIGLLFFKLMIDLTESRVVGFLSIVIYLLSPVHSVELYYLSSVQTLSATAFILLGLITYREFLKVKSNKFFFFAVGLFIISSLCHESAVIFPGFVLMLELFYFENKTSFKYTIYRLSFIFLLILPRLYIHFFITGLPHQQAYQPTFSPKSALNSFGWFTLWSFGFPESLVDFVGPGFHINNNFLIWFGGYVKLIFPLIILVLLALLSIIICSSKFFINSKLPVFLICYYVFSLLPFLFFPEHKFVYYLSLSTVWFSAILGLSLTFLTFNRLSRVYLTSLILCLALISYQTANFNQIAHWAAKRQSAAKFLLENFRKEYPYLPKGSQIYIKKDPDYPFISSQWGSSAKQASYILSGSDALQLIYRDPGIKVYYEGEKDQQVKDPHYFTAKFPY